MATKIQSGNSTAGLANVDSAYQLLVVTEKDVTNNPENVGGIKIFSENDDGKVTGTPYLASPETDDDYSYSRKMFSFSYWNCNGSS